MFAARVRSAWHRPLQPVEVPGAPTPEVAAVVDATGACREELRTTLLSMGRVHGLGEVAVVDRGASSTRRDVAQRLGATVHAPDVGVEAAVERATAAWVLVVAAGDLPTPDLVVMATSTCCAPHSRHHPARARGGRSRRRSRPTTTGDGRSNPSSSRWCDRRSPRRGSIPWYGDGPTLIRRGALQQAGGWAEGATTWSVGLALVRHGFSVTHLPPDPRSGARADRVRRRPRPAGVRRHGPALRSLVDGSLRGLSRPAKIAHVLGAVPFVGAVQRVLLVAAAVMVLGWSRLPFDASGAALVALAVPAYGLRWVTHLVLGRGLLGRLSLLRADLRTLGVDLTPFVHWTPVGARRMGAGALVALVVALDTAVVVSAVAVWREWSGRLPGEIAAGALLLTAVFVGVAVEVVLDAIVHRQRRRNRRVRLGLVNLPARRARGAVDRPVGPEVSASPCGVHPPTHRGRERRQPCSSGSPTPTARGARGCRPRCESSAARRPSRIPGPEHSSGSSSTTPRAAPLDPVIEFLTIDRRLVAMGRRSSFV